MNKIIKIFVFTIMFSSCSPVYKINCADKYKIVHINNSVLNGIKNLQDKINFCLKFTNGTILLEYTKIKNKHNEQLICTKKEKIEKMVKNYILLKNCLQIINEELNTYKKLSNFEKNQTNAK